jgi:opacity protein-like surface antigen
MLDARDGSRVPDFTTTAAGLRCMRPHAGLGGMRDRARRKAALWPGLAAVFAPALLALPLAMPAGGRTRSPVSLPADKMLIRRLFGIGIMALSVFWGCPVVGQVFYVGGEGGWTHLLVKRSFDEASESSAGPVPGIGVQDIWGEGYDFGARAGYEWGPWRLEGELVTRDNPVAEQRLYSTAGGTAVSTGINSNVSGERQSWGLMANFLYQADLQWLGLDPPASPYLGVGIGTARLHAVTHSQNTLITDSADTQLAYQGIIGLRYLFSDAVAVDLSWHYFAATDPTFSRVDGTRFPGNYETENVMLALVFRFLPAGASVGN